MIYTVRRKNESNERAMRRFKKSVQDMVRSGRQQRYYKKKKTKLRIREEAIKRTEYREKKFKKILMS
jgi:ribosomal protein S21